MTKLTVEEALRTARHRLETVRQFADLAAVTDEEVNKLALSGLADTTADAAELLDRVKAALPADMLNLMLRR